MLHVYVRLRLRLFFTKINVGKTKHYFKPADPDSLVILSDQTVNTSFYSKPK